MYFFVNTMPFYSQMEKRQFLLKQLQTILTKADVKKNWHETRSTNYSEKLHNQINVTKQYPPLGNIIVNVGHYVFIIKQVHSLLGDITSSHQQPLTQI